MQLYARHALPGAQKRAKVRAPVDRAAPPRPGCRRCCALRLHRGDDDRVVHATQRQVRQVAAAEDVEQQVLQPRKCRLAVPRVALEHKARHRAEELLWAREGRHGLKRRDAQFHLVEHVRVERAALWVRGGEGVEGSAVGSDAPDPAQCTHEHEVVWPLLAVRCKEERGAVAAAREEFEARRVLERADLVLTRQRVAVGLLQR